MLHAAERRQLQGEYLRDFDMINKEMTVRPRIDMMEIFQSLIVDGKVLCT